MLTEVLTLGVGGTLLFVALTWLVCRFALRSPSARNTLWRVALPSLPRERPGASRAFSTLPIIWGRSSAPSAQGFCCYPCTGS